MLLWLISFVSLRCCCSLSAQTFAAKFSPHFRFDHSRVSFDINPFFWCLNISKYWISLGFDLIFYKVNSMIETWSAMLILSDVICSESKSFSSSERKFRQNEFEIGRHVQNESYSWSADTCSALTAAHLYSLSMSAAVILVSSPKCSSGGAPAVADLLSAVVC